MIQKSVQHLAMDVLQNGLQSYCQLPREKTSILFCPASEIWEFGDLCSELGWYSLLARLGEYI